MSTLLPFQPAPPINPLLEQIEKKVRLGLRPGRGIYPGRSINWAANRIEISAQQLETIESGMRGDPTHPDDDPGLYALGEKIGAEVRA